MPRVTSMLVSVCLVGFLAGCSNGDGDDMARSCDSLTRTDLTLSDAGHSVAALATLKGCIVAEFFDDKAPITVENFKTYTREGFFNDTIFHRVSKDFVLQGGGVSSQGDQKQTNHPPIRNEAVSSGLKNLKYTFSMARQTSPDSATSQFFINLKDNAGLDPGGQGPGSAGYAVFATVVQGQDVVEKIHSVSVTTSNAHPYCIGLEDRSGGSCPVDPVHLFSVRLL